MLGGGSLGALAGREVQTAAWLAMSFKQLQRALSPHQHSPASLTNSLSSQSQCIRSCKQILCSFSRPTGLPRSGSRCGCQRGTVSSSAGASRDMSAASHTNRRSAYAVSMSTASWAGRSPNASYRARNGSSSADLGGSAAGVSQVLTSGSCRDELGGTSSSEGQRTLGPSSQGSQENQGSQSSQSSSQRNQSSSQRGHGDQSGERSGPSPGDSGLEEDRIEATFTCRSEDDTAMLAAAVALHVARGDVICLRGPVGSGKTMFSRHLIRALADDAHLAVPSPTFMLQLAYDLPCSPPVHHYDLYRLSATSNFRRVGLEESLSQAVSLIEWPECLGQALPKERLDVVISMQPQEETGVASGSSSTTGARATNTESHNDAITCTGARSGTLEEPPITLSHGLQQEEEEEGEGEGSGMYADERPRQFTLIGYGRRWRDVVLALVRS